MNVIIKYVLYFYFYPDHHCTRAKKKLRSSRFYGVFFRFVLFFAGRQLNVIKSMKKADDLYTNNDIKLR